MYTSLLRALTLSGLSCALFASPPQDGSPQATGINFASPVRLMAGDSFVGANRLYPSPIMRDVDGDGRLDIVVGDLFGAVTYASRDANPQRIGFAAKQSMKDIDGEKINFHNW